MRFSFASRNAVPTTSDALLHPIKISRATARMNDLMKYYSSDIGFEHIKTVNGSDGSQTGIFMLESPTENFQIHFVEGRPVSHDLITTKQAYDDTFTPKDWEDYM